MLSSLHAVLACQFHGMEEQEEKGLRADINKKFLEKEFLFSPQVEVQFNDQVITMKKGGGEGGRRAQDVFEENKSFAKNLVQ